jgi:hypothetical protein
MPIFTNITINQTNCTCDGGIVVNTTNGTPPYSYSIDGGISFKNSPIFTNMCQGNYVVVVQDYSGETSSNFVTINPPQNPISYSVFLSTSQKTLQESNDFISRQYTTSINFFPVLPDNVSVTFDLIHSNILSSGPNYSSATASSVSTLTINTGTTSNSYSGSTTGSTNNQNSGCQNQPIYSTTFMEGWNSVTLTNNDTFILTTTTNLYKNDTLPCYVGTTEEIYTISNLSISGCTCCKVVKS